MKRTPLTRKTTLRRGTVALRRTKLRVKGISDTSVIKDEIQAILREIVILRDGGCWLRHYPQAGRCSGYRKDGQLILQAEHLHTRANSASYADPRLVVCICRNHHIFWKPQYGDLYNQLAEEYIGPERTALWERIRNDRSPHKADWVLEKIALLQHLNRLKLECQLSTVDNADR